MTTVATATPDTTTIGTLTLSQLDPDHWPNPRGPVDTAAAAFAELCASIKAQGILEPIVVGPALDELDGRYPILAGWRRYTAAREGGLDLVPVHHRPDIATELAALEAALAENMAREDMTPLAEASALKRLVDLGRTQVDAATFVGVSERTARERLRLLDLPDAIRKLVDAGDVPTTCTRQLQLVADASPEVAVSIAKRIKKGTVKAFELLDARSLYGVLETLSRDPQIPLVLLRWSVDPSSLGLSPATTKELAARSKKANAGDGQAYQGAALHLQDVPPKLLGEAKAAGKVLAVEHGSFVTGEWVEKVAVNAIERTERRAARRKRETEKVKAGAKVTDDPRAQAKAERDALDKAIAERARPYALQMNEELGRRLRALESCALDGAVGRLLIRLATTNHGEQRTDRNARDGYPYVDPQRTLRDVRDLEPNEAAAELVSAHVAAAFCDSRANGEHLSHGWAVVDVWEILREVALDLNLLPDRAIRLAAARERLLVDRVSHNLRGARRRILLELVESEDAAVESGTLRAQTTEHCSDIGGYADVDSVIPTYQEDRYQAAIQQLITHGEIAGAARDEDLYYEVTDDGRAALAATPGPEPMLEDIDGIGVDLQLVDEPPASDDEADGDGASIVLERPERSVPAKQRKARALELIRAHPGITIPGLANGMALKQNGLYRLLPALVDAGLVRKEGRGWHIVEQDTKPDVVIVHVKPTNGGDPVEAELQPDPAHGTANSRKVIYTASRTSAWVAESRIIDLPAESAAAA